MSNRCVCAWGWSLDRCDGKTEKKVGAGPQKQNKTKNKRQARKKKHKNFYVHAVEFRIFSLGAAE